MKAALTTVVVVLWLSEQGGREPSCKESSQVAVPVVSLSALTVLPPEKLENVEIGRMNLLWGNGLRGTDSIDPHIDLATLDVWASSPLKNLQHTGSGDPAYNNHEKSNKRNGCGPWPATCSMGLDGALSLRLLQSHHWPMAHAGPHRGGGYRPPLQFCPEPANTGN